MSTSEARKGDDAAGYDPFGRVVYERVNGALLRRLVGKPVGVVGRMVEVNVLLTSDGQKVCCYLLESFDWCFLLRWDWVVGLCERAHLRASARRFFL